MSMKDQSIIINNTDNSDNGPEYSNEEKTNMILSSKLLENMIDQLKEGLGRVEKLVQSESEFVLILKELHDKTLFKLSDMNKDNAIQNEQLVTLVKDQVLSILREIANESRDHDAIIAAIDNLDSNFNNVLATKIKLVMQSIGNNSEEHKTITTMVTEIDDKTSGLIEDKNIELIKRVDESMQKFDSVFEMLEKVADKLSILDSKILKIILSVGVFIGTVGFISAIVGIYGAFFK